MAGISTSVQVVDRVSGALNRITANLYNTTAAFGAVDRASETSFNTAGVQAMAQEMYAYEQRIQQLEHDLVDANRRLEEMEDTTNKVSQAGFKLNGIYRMVAGVVSAISLQKVFNASDELVQTTSRLNMMNDGLQTTDELARMTYASAQNARGSFQGMADVVARFGNNAKDAFESSAEIVAFSNLVQKQMTIAGASNAESANAMLQLSQALGSGVLRGDELNSIFEQAPNLIQSIADYLDVPIGKIREMASEGELTADIVKASVFASADDINAKFEEMPKTWGQIWQSMQNTALMKFQPVLQRLNNMANSERFETFVEGATTAMTVGANVVISIFDVMGAFGSFVYDNWSVIGPIVWGVITALGIYYGAQLASNVAGKIGTGIHMAMAAAQMAHAAMTGSLITATAAEIAAQNGLNTAMYACPVVWITIAIIALITVVVMLCNWIAKTTDIAETGFGVIAGGVNVAIQFFWNLLLVVANVALGIWNALGTCANNLKAVFWEAISAVQSWFYGLLSTALTTVAGIAEALSKLPFVDIDYSGLTSKADEYAAKAAEASGSSWEHKNVTDAFYEGYNTFDTFKDGWVTDAFKSGATWGDEKLNGLTAMFDTSAIDSAYLTTDEGSVADSLTRIADDTAGISDSVDISNENLKYMRDVAERDAINRFTTAEIKVDMQNNNNISSDMDIDGIVEHLTIGVQEAMEQAAEGVHE